MRALEESNSESIAEDEAINTGKLSDLESFSVDSGGFESYGFLEDSGEELSYEDIGELEEAG